MAASRDTASLLQDECSRDLRSGRDEVHDDIVDARLGERNGCDDEGGEEGRGSISQDEADSAEDVDGGADVIDGIFSIAVQ